jgi:hypothetical protein
MARCVHEEAVPFMRKQYHLWPAGTGFDAWDVDRLISLSKELPVHPVTVDSVGEVDTVYWFDSSTGGPTVRAVRFPDLPEPDYRNCQPADLPY